MNQREKDLATFRLWTKASKDPSQLMADGAEYGRKDGRKEERKALAKRLRQLGYVSLIHQLGLEADE